MPRRKIALKSRFYRFIERTETCWTWTGGRTRSGYGAMGVEGRARLAHRVSWELHRWPLPEGARLRHLCANRACVRPEHLEIRLETLPGDPCASSPPQS